MDSLWTALFWKAALERAIKSAAQGVLWSWVVADKIASLINFDWGVAGYAAGGMFIFSILTSIVSAPTAGAGPSFGGAEVVAPAPPAPPA